MTDWSERMIKALQLNGLSERTQESYVRTVRMLTEHCKKTPESITEDELREYFLYRKNVSSWSPKTTCESAIAESASFTRTSYGMTGTSSISSAPRRSTGCLPSSARKKSAGYCPASIPPTTTPT